MGLAAEGGTNAAGAKLGQMMWGSLRAYKGGARPGATRRQIVVDYLDSLPLAAAHGRGEVLGLGDGLRIWYGAPFLQANALLSTKPVAADATRARVFKRALSLILAARRPYYYLVENPRALEEFTDGYLRVLARAGVIDVRLRDAALAERLQLRRRGAAPPGAFVERHGANPVRAPLPSLLSLPAPYHLHPLHLTARR